MGFLDLIKEDHTVGLAPDGFGQLSAFLIPHISRRSSDQSGYGEFLHIFTHVDTDHVLFIVKQGLRQCLGKFRFTDAGRSEEQEGTDRFRGILDAGFGTQDRIRHQTDTFVLSDHPLVQLVFQMQKLGPLPLCQSRYRDPGPAGDDPGDLVIRHCFMDQPVFILLRSLLFHLQHVLQLRKFAVLQLRSLFQIVVLLCFLDLFIHILDLLTDLLFPGSGCQSPF